MKVWDYKVTKPLATTQAKLWQTVRQIDWGDLEEVDPEFLRAHFDEIKERIDPAKRLLIEQFLSRSHA